ncbi:MAG: DUF2249 domain-containing protein [Aliivibrio sp.]|uniref:DUF2249 domain-containing protein n=1 Tax=Aliivibrio sp. TaxID=1872443 RepID=UPI001A46A6D0|nr:DUF2249 domain-containing protein [Aliivibrio sp.]
MDISKVSQLDVSDLEPPQPMNQITAALHKLAAGEVIAVKHRRKPVPLFEMIAGRFDHICVEVSPSQFQLYFWQREDNDAKILAELLCNEKHPL